MNMTPHQYIAAIEDDSRRSDVEQLHELIRETLPDLEPHVRYGMLGYGEYHYRYASGREGDASIVGLASQKRYISLYVMCTTDQGYLAETYRERLPKADIGKSCVRFKRNSDVDLDVVRAMLVEAGENMPEGAAAS